MALVDEVRKLVGVADRLKGPVGNEANTKALLIEPMLSALGWDTTNLDHVVRDWPVHDDTSIDYALRIDDANALLVEARGVNERLDDETFTTRAVDGAADDGALWCVLTNGLTYRVYRTDELVPTEQKLSFELDLAKVAAGSPADSANLPLLSRASLVDGSLALWGEQQVFTDPRVRTVLSQLAAKPTPAFLDAINDAIGEHKVTRDRLRASLARVLVIENAPSRDTKAAPTARATDTAPRPRDTPKATEPATETAPAPHNAGTPRAAGPLERTDAAATPHAGARADTVLAADVDTVDTADATATPDTARRRFLGGQARTPRDTAGDPPAAGRDAYAPLASPSESSDAEDS